MSNWLVFDFETMSTNSLNCAAIDLSTIIVDTDRFVSDKPYTLRSITEVKRFKLSVKDQVENYGFEVSPSTVNFWLNQSKEVRDKIKPKSTDLPLVDFAEIFHNYLIESPKIKYWWSRSNTFDPVVLYRIFEATKKINHLNEYLPYGKVRDIRTYIDAKLDFPKDNNFVPIENSKLFEEVFKQHDSSWDVIADVLRLQAIARGEHDLPMVEK